MNYIAHRGYSSKQTENTLEAAILAGEKSYFYGIEFDVHVTKDKKFIVHHDDTTKRLGNVELVIKESTYDELQKVKLQNKITKAFNLRIPLLSEYIEVCNKYNKVCVLEMKHLFIEDDIKELLKEIKKANNIIVISFYMDNLINLRKLNKDIKIQFLTSQFNEEYYKICFNNNFDLDLNKDLITKENMNYYKKHNFLVNCWTINDNNLANEYINLGIDFITTDGLLEYK